MSRIKSIDIITSPFGCIPPHAIGAVEKRWKSCGDYFMSKGIKVVFVCKRPDNGLNADCLYVNGYERTGSWLKDFLLDFVYSFKALRNAPRADVVVLNTIWSPVLLPLFNGKFKVSVYNVARFPKHQFGFYKAVDALSCVSMAVYDSLVRQTPSVKGKCCVISNFVDEKVFRQHKRHILPEVPCVVYSGRINREKGLDLLVKAVDKVRKCRKVSLKLIGAYDVERGGSGRIYKEELDRLADGWDIEWVSPIYSPAKLAEEMDKGDIFCYPSVADKGETFGVAPLEAMALGLPTIVSDLACFKDFIRDKENGLVFNHCSAFAIDELSKCINSLLCDKDLYALLSENAVTTSHSFSVEAKAEEYLLLFNNLYSLHSTGFDCGKMRIMKL